MQANKDTLCLSKGRYEIKESFTCSWRVATFGERTTEGKSYSLKYR